MELIYFEEEEEKDHHYKGTYTLLKSLGHLEDGNHDPCWCNPKGKCFFQMANGKEMGTYTVVRLLVNLHRCQVETKIYGCTYYKEDENDTGTTKNKGKKMGAAITFLLIQNNDDCLVYQQ